VFANRPARHRHRVSETVIRERRDTSRAAQYVQAPPPRASTPIIRPATPPRIMPAPSPPSPRIELVNVEEDRRSSPRTSRVSVSTGRKRRTSRAGEEVYIERERERVRLPQEKREEYDTYRYVPGPTPDRQESEDLRRSRSITYETNPRHSQRIIERERVVVEDGGRRREYYRRP